MRCENRFFIKAIVYGSRPKFPGYSVINNRAQNLPDKSSFYGNFLETMRNILKIAE